MPVAVAAPALTIWNVWPDVVPVACPALVPLIESDDPYGTRTVEAVREYAEPLKAAGVDRRVRAREKASDHAPVWIDLDPA